MAASPSFSFATPELQRRGFPDATDSEDWHFRDGPSPIQPARFRGEEQDESKAANERGQNGYMSPFRRRNRLETRLEELQKDVASLTLKLRSNGDRSRSLDASSFLLTPQEEKKSQVNTPRASETRPRNMKTNMATPSNRPRNMATSSNKSTSSVRALRELHDVTTERDQLKFELEKTKRALKAAEKKSQEAARGRKAYEKLKAHCDSLQESLDLSERIRVRQKKLLQQLQLQQQRKEKAKVADRTRSASAKKRPGSAASRSTATTPKQVKPTQGYTHAGYDILDSLVASSHHADEEDEEEEAGLATHEQSPSEPTAASRTRTPRSVLKPSTPVKPYRSDFDSLLQVDAPQFSTRRPSRIATNASRRPSQTQIQQREAMRQAARWARSRGAAVDISTSTTPLSRRTAAAAARPKKSFLAPTQASLRRLHDAPRHGGHERPPFVV